MALISIINRHNGAKNSPYKKSIVDSNTILICFLFETQLFFDNFDLLKHFAF